MIESPPQHPIGIGAGILLRHRINQLRFESAQELLGQGGVLIDETGRKPTRGAELLLAVQATRASNTFESVILLCLNGRGVQASMLNRSLLEDVLDVHWVAANPDAAPTMADRHERLAALAERKSFLDAGRRGVPLTPEEEAELAELMREYSNLSRSWNLASTTERRDLVSERWGRAASQQLDFVYDVIQKQNNVLLHGSPTAYKHAMTVDGDGRLRGVNRIGTDGRWLESLGHGALAYYFICRVVAEHFEFDKGPAADAFYRASCYLKQFFSDELDGIEPDADCPCESGRCFGECHGFQKSGTN